MIIVPYIKVGDLLFNDKKAQIRKKLNTYFEQGCKEFGSIKDHYDYFTEMGLFVLYDEHDNVNAFEFFEPGPQFKGIDLFSLSYKEIVDLFSDIDDELETEYGGFTSKKYGIGGGTEEDLDNDDASITSLIVFRKGYYDL